MAKYPSRYSLFLFDDAACIIKICITIVSRNSFLPLAERQNIIPDTKKRMTPSLTRPNAVEANHEAVSE
ncbi:hypothetical protein ACFL6I_06350 [candidate division KSB1 bacterium]